MLHRILLATDFSESAARAHTVAACFASACQARIEVLHVLEFTPLFHPEYLINSRDVEQFREENGRQVGNIVKILKHHGIVARGLQVFGIASQEIIEAAQEHESDLVVVGARGRTGLEHIALGSTAERVVRGSPCPVLTVGPNPSAACAQTGTLTLKRILTPIDFSDCSLDALEHTIQVAKHFHAAVTILHVMESVSMGLNGSSAEIADRMNIQKQLESRLPEIAEVLTSQGLTAAHRIQEGAPVDSILKTAEQEACDLIIMGMHGREGMSRVLGNSVAESILSYAACPVVTVKSPKFTPGHRRAVPMTAMANAEP